MSINQKTIMTGFIWRFFERTGAQLVGLVVSIILARILSTTDYGTVGLMNVFINILSVFINGGFSSALIQKKDADDTDFSSVFYAQMLICVFLYICIFFAAPWIASFYGMVEMKSMIRVLGLTLIIAGVKNVQIAFVSRNMMFKKFFFATLGGTIGAAGIGISMALAGFGAWALIGQSLFNNTVDTIILWIMVKWRPKRSFSLNRLKSLFSYGWKLFVSNLLDVGYNDLRALIIGKMYSATDLAYYEKGNSWPVLIIRNVNSSIDSVLLPSMSKAQEDKKHVKMMTRRAIKTSTYVMAPMMMGLAFCGEPLVKWILTDKWLPIVPFQFVFCITYMFYPIHTANLNAIKALGRSDLFLKLEIIKKSTGLILLILTAPMGVMPMAYSLLASSTISQMVNAYPNKKLLDYGFLEQLKDILPGILLATFMGMTVYWFKFLPLHEGLILLIQIVVGVIIYIGFSMTMKLEAFLYIIGIVNEFRSKRVKRNHK